MQQVLSILSINYLQRNMCALFLHKMFAIIIQDELQRDNILK